MSALLFALRPILVKLAYVEGLDPTSLMLLRMLFSAPIYIVILLLLLHRLNDKNDASVDGHWPFDRRIILHVVATGLFGYYAASYLDLLGLQYITAQLGRMILYLYPTLVVLGTAIYFKKVPSNRTIGALILAYLGVLVIFGYDLRAFGSNTLLGSFYIVLCAACFAAYLVLSKPLITRLGSGLFTCVALLSASVAIALHYAISVSFSLQDLPGLASFTPRAYWLCLAIAIFSTVLPTFLTAAAIGRIGAGPTSIASMIGPGFTSVFAVMVLGEQFTIYHAVGIVLIVAGIFFMERK